MKYRIAVIGCGKLGGPTANYLEEIGHDVRRYDIAFDTGYTHAEAVQDRDMILIAVPTPHDPLYDGSKPISHLPTKNFDYTALTEAVRTTAKYSKSATIVVISTVLPGTIRRLFADLEDRLIYNPYLISMGAVAADLADPDIVIIGTANGNFSLRAKELHDIHESMIGDSPKCHFGTWEEAESIKIFYNTFISTKLSLVNMIQDVAMKTGNMNVDRVTNALQDATMRITGPKYMTPGMGDGGPCHPRDNIALRWLAEDLDLGYDLFSAIMQSREAQAKNLALFLVKLSDDNNLPVYIHGKSFKPGVPYVDGSYSLLVGHYVKELSGKEVIYIDPLTDPIKDACGVVLLAHNESVTYNYIMPTAESQLYCDILPGSIVVDPWRNYTTTKQSIKVIHYGNSRRSSA